MLKCKRLLIVLALAANVFSCAADPAAKPDMILAEGGSFRMGEPGFSVSVSSFYVSRYEVTVAEWRAFTDETGYEFPWEGMGRIQSAVAVVSPSENCPVPLVSLTDAASYCNWLSLKHGYKPAYVINGDSIKWNRKASGYRLPTEAEWEYAARGGRLTKGYIYAGSDDPDKVAWYIKNSERRTHPVGRKVPNELGLYDMSGNIYERCWDYFGLLYFGEANTGFENPVNMRLSDSYDENARIIKGGSYLESFEEIKTRNRWGAVDYVQSDMVGFRLFRNAG